MAEYKSGLNDRKNQSYNILVNAKEIESPLSVFNNIQLQIASTLSEIFYPGMNKKVIQLLAKNQLIFRDKSIMIMGKFKLQQGSDGFMELNILCTKPRMQELEYLSQIYKNYEHVTAAFNQYIIMYNRICSNYQEVPYELINTIMKGIHNQDSVILDRYYLLPFKEKFNRLMLEDKKYDKDTEELLLNIYGRYDFCIKFSLVKGFLNYKIYRLLSSLMNENKSLENIRFEDVEIIKSDNIQIQRANEFVYQLFNYSEII